jgi:hypothetical protein
MGVSYVSDIVPNLLPPSEKVYWWQPTHPIVKNVPQFTGAWSGGYVDFGDYIQETYGTIDHSIAGFSVSPQNAKSAIVVANDNRTIVNSFIIDENRNDLDADSVLDAVELYMNEIQFVISSPPRQAVGGEILPTVIPTLLVVLVLAVAIGLATGLHLSKRGQWILIKP